MKCPIVREAHILGEGGGFDYSSKLKGGGGLFSGANRGWDTGLGLATIVSRKEYRVHTLSGGGRTNVVVFASWGYKAKVWLGVNCHAPGGPLGGAGVNGNQS